VFSAEISAADAVLFMLATSLSQDLYKRFIHPEAGDATVLRVARRATVVSGVLGVALSLAFVDLVETLTIFYALLGVSLFVPIVAGLYVRRTSSSGALASIAAGVAGWSTIHLATGGTGWSIVTPPAAGLLSAIAAWAITLAVSRR